MHRRMDWTKSFCYVGAGITTPHQCQQDLPVNGWSVQQCPVITLFSVEGMKVVYTGLHHTRSLQIRVGMVVLPTG